MAKRLAPFRVPKGVPRDIRRALRLPTAGRFLSTVKALQLHDLLEVRERETQRAHAAAARAFDRARRPETREKHLRALRAAQAQHGALQHGLDQLSASAAREPLPPLAGRDVVPTVRAAEFDTGYTLPGESALEWEIGVDYTEELAGKRHHKGRASDVSFNARIFDPRKEPLTEFQVREAIDHFAATGDLGYRSGRRLVPLAVRTVSWANWKGDQFTSKDADDLDSFRAILRRVGDGGLRVGAVKPDRL